MSHSSSLAGARPRTGRNAANRIVTALAAATVAAGGMLVVPATQPAQAAEPVAIAAPIVRAAAIVKTPTSLKLTVKNATFQRGARTKASPLIIVTVRAKGRAAVGAVRVTVAGKARSAKVAKGRAQVRLPSGVKLGRHKATVTFVPKAGSPLKGSRATTSVTAKRYSSRVLEVAAKYQGVRYRYGGSTPKGFDCSGFTSYVYRKAGVKKMAHSAASQRRAGRAVSRASARPGDLIYSPGHIAIYAGGNRMIDAPRPGQRVGFRKMWQRHPVFVRVSTKAITL